MKHDELSKRMKKYEFANRRYLTNRMPVIVRIDGRSFHTFTKGFERPFDDLLIDTMQKTMKYLCENIMNCVLGYHQSDEITLVLADYKTIYTNPWFGNCQNKIESICASMATNAFKNNLLRNIYETYKDKVSDHDFLQWIIYGNVVEQIDIDNLAATYLKAINKGAEFDCRAFNIPVDEVTNNIYWRQIDATRNSIQMVGQSHFSHKQLDSKKNNDIQDMLFTQKGINWNDYPAYKKRGSCCVKNKIVIESDGIKDLVRLRDMEKRESNWIIDKNIPIFKGEGREYIEKLIRF